LPFQNKLKTSTLQKKQLSKVQNAFGAISLISGFFKIYSNSVNNSQTIKAQKATYIIFFKTSPVGQNLSLKQIFRQVPFNKRTEIQRKRKMTP